MSDSLKIVSPGSMPIWLVPPHWQAGCLDGGSMIAACFGAALTVLPCRLTACVTALCERHAGLATECDIVKCRSGS